MTSAAGLTTSLQALDAEKLRKDFPILRTKAHGKPLVSLDNAATAQKPSAVIDRITEYYTTENSNIHRGVHLLSEKATELSAIRGVSIERQLALGHRRVYPQPAQTMARARSKVST